jgi:hypothetical protein
MWQMQYISAQLAITLLTHCLQSYSSSLTIWIHSSRRSDAGKLPTHTCAALAHQSPPNDMPKTVNRARGPYTTMAGLIPEASSPCLGGYIVATWWRTTLAGLGYRTHAYGSGMEILGQCFGIRERFLALRVYPHIYER